MNNSCGTPKLGKSPFNYSYYGPEKFIHYYQQIAYVLRLAPNTVLEIGPGDHAVTDFLRRKGVSVDTYDNDEQLLPTYLGDIRQPFITRKTYDLVLASEVFEHMNIKFLSQILSNVKKVLSDDGILLVSLPYTTLRLFPPRGSGDKIVSLNGRMHTYIPWYICKSIVRWPRMLYRFARRRQQKPDTVCYADDRFDVHHWDLGMKPTTRRFVREIFAQHFVILEENISRNTNCVFYILKGRPGGL